ncbi:UNVERIFIED_CONTAM: GDSL esterase/lipase [Sesamum radiatum]|uniref:GDSL esterase/lipase n=1 Tax=Sesamum radiatum TaxID=300843 RepID=A0AAW2KID9_SESRA
MPFFTFEAFSTCFLLLFFATKAAAARDIRNVKAESSPVSAILIFGDSTADPGNNNYIATPFRSNFSPYGKDFVNQTPTGRFTNGRLANDFIECGLPVGAAGHFKEYRAKLEAGIGKDKTKELIKNALFLVSAGTNDFVVNYFTIPIRRYNYTIPSYMNFVLQEALQLLQIKSSGARIAYIDIYGPLEAMTSGRKYGFEEVSTGCCGTGMLEASFMCNPKSAVCADATKYVFWDSIHPTEKSYELLFQAFRPVIDALVKN